MNWMLMPLRRYAEFSGRSRRREYWMFTLFYWVVFILLFGLLFAGLPWSEMVDPARTDNEISPPNALTYIGGALLLIFWLATFVPQIAVTVRRFHDQNMSGWMYLLTFVPFVGGIIILVFMCLPGTRGPNSFGDDTKLEHAADAFL